MRTQFYLTVNSRGTVKATKNRPDLKWDEISVEMNLTLPNALFQKPHLVAQIVVPNSAADPKQIDVETHDNIKNAIETAAGMEVRLEIISQHQD